MCVLNYKRRYVNKIIVPDEKNYPKNGAYYYDYYGKPLMNWLFWNRLYNAFNILNKMNLLRKDFIALDAGCGGGIILPTLARFFKKVVALDRNPKLPIYKNWLQTNYPEITNVDFIIGDITRMPFQNNYFDIIFSFDVLENIKNTDIAVSEISRVLKSGGYVCITIPIEGIMHRIGRVLYKLNEPDHYKGVVKSQEELVHLFMDITDIEIIKDVVTPFNFLPKSFNVFRLVIFQKTR